MGEDGSPDDAALPLPLMRYVKDSPLELGFRVWQLRPPTPSLTVVVKGTFDPAAGDPAPFAEEQLPASGGAYWDDDVEKSLRAPSDFALLKPRGECFVIGKAWAPGGRPTTMLACGFKLGPIEKSFAVFGDRRWKKGLVRSMSEPEPFTEMELRMERAYGGPGFAANPYGCGREELDGELPVPNLEQARDLISSPASKPDPVVIGPLPVGWPERMRYAGTYDQYYLRERWPWLPSDFDWRFFLEAPPDQQLREGFWRGDERIEFRNLHPSISSVRSRLPAIAPRLFIDIEHAGNASFSEIRLVLDTVTWNAETGKLLLTWRGLVEVPSESLDEVRHLFIAHDPLDGPMRSSSELKARFDALLAEEEKEEEEAEGEEPPSVTAAPRSEPEPEPEAEDDAEPEPTPEERELEAKMAALEAQLAEMGIELPKEQEQEAEPPDPKELLAKLEASGADVPPELAQLLAELAEPEQPEEDEAEEPPPPEPPPAPEGRALVEARLAAGEPLTELDLTGVDLSGLDLSGQDFSGSILREANLAGVTLSGANLSGCVLAESELERADLREANLVGADLNDASLPWADLRGATLEDADLEGARFVGARLDGVKGARAVFVAAEMSEAVLSGGDFTEADFERAVLDRADLSRAILKDATLEGASAQAARFERAVMTKCRGEGLRASEARFGSIDAEDSFWERAELTRADFSFATLTRADFSDAVLIGTEMDGCAMRQARFDRANAHSLCARKADLMEASFESADLSFADLRGANLFGAELWRANVTSAELELANVTRTKLAE